MPIGIPISNLYALRLAQGWTQRELAARAGLHLRTVGSIERGIHDPTPDSLAALAAALGVPEADLIKKEP